MIGTRFYGGVMAGMVGIWGPGADVMADMVVNIILGVLINMKILCYI